MSALPVAAQATVDAAGWGYGPHPGPWFLLFPLVWFLWLALGIAVVVTLLRRHRFRPGFGPWPAARAEALLGERFARGEIDEAEYRSRVETLRGTSR